MQLGGVQRAARANAAIAGTPGVPGRWGAMAAAGPAMQAAGCRDNPGPGAATAPPKPRRDGRWQRARASSCCCSECCVGRPSVGGAISGACQAAAPAGAPVATRLPSSLGAPQLHCCDCCRRCCRRCRRIPQACQLLHKVAPQSASRQCRQAGHCWFGCRRAQQRRQRQARVERPEQVAVAVGGGHVAGPHACGGGYPAWSPVWQGWRIRKPTRAPKRWQARALGINHVKPHCNSPSAGKAAPTPKVGQQAQVDGQAQAAALPLRRRLQDGQRNRAPAAGRRKVQRRAGGRPGLGGPQAHSHVAAHCSSPAGGVAGKGCGLQPAAGTAAGPSGRCRHGWRACAPVRDAPQLIRRCTAARLPWCAARCSGAVPKLARESIYLRGCMACRTAGGCRVAQGARQQVAGRQPQHAGAHADAGDASLTAPAATSMRRLPPPVVPLAVSQQRIPQQLPLLPGSRHHH